MLLTRPPLSTGASSCFSFDLHVWSTPPAFVLSQDQTLHCQKSLSILCITTELWLIRCFFVVLIIRFRINKFSILCIVRARIKRPSDVASSLPLLCSFAYGRLSLASACACLSILLSMCRCRRFLHKGILPSQILRPSRYLLFRFQLRFFIWTLVNTLIHHSAPWATSDRSPHSELFNLIASIFYVKSSFYISLHRSKNSFRYC